MSIASIRELNPDLICDPNVDMVLGEPFESKEIYIFAFPQRRDEEKSFCLTKNELESTINNSRVRVWINYRIRSTIEQRITVHRSLRNVGPRYPVPVFRFPHNGLWVKKFPVPNETTIYRMYPSFISELGTRLGVSNMHGGEDYVVYEARPIDTETFLQFIEEKRRGNIPRDEPTPKLEWIESFLQNPAPYLDLNDNNNDEEIIEDNFLPILPINQEVLAESERIRSENEQINRELRPSENLRYLRQQLRDANEDLRYLEGPQYIRDRTERYHQEDESVAIRFRVANLRGQRIQELESEDEERESERANDNLVHQHEILAARRVLADLQRQIERAE